MARSVRATTLLLTALGVAAPVLPCSAAVAANTGGAAPGSTVAVSSSVNGGAGTSGTPAPAPSSSPTPVRGAAAPGATPARKATSRSSGGAVPGHRPRRKVVPPPAKPPAKAKTKATSPAKPAPAPSSSAAPTVAGVFPLVGPYTFGGLDARFGAQRNGHIHQGQDVIASSGTPIVAPVAGTIIQQANQPGGAGIYLILHTASRDYAFMHIKRGTLQVAVGDAVRPGQRLAQVGATGDASGPHLHFEIWVGGWYVKGGAPIDPLPQLERWAGSGA